MPIPWVLGTYGWIQGNIVAKSKRREVKKTDDGKGSGTETSTYEAHQDFCLLVCESSEIRNSTVVGPLIIRVNGKIVYDMRPGKSFGAENAKFIERHTFYVGNEDQMPDPTLEAIYGIGDTPSHRGVFTIVCRDINLTQYGDAIPTYEFVMVSEGANVEVATETYQPYKYPPFFDSAYPLTTDPSLYLFNNATRVEATPIGHVGPFYAPEDALDLFTRYSSAGWLFAGYKSTVDAGSSVSGVIPQASVVDNVNLLLTYTEGEPDLVVPGAWGDTEYTESVFNSYPPGTLVEDSAGYFVRYFDGPQDPAPPGIEGFIFTDSGLIYSYRIPPVDVVASRVPMSPAPPIGDPCLIGGPTQLPDTPGFTQDCEGTIAPTPAYSDATVGSYLILQPGITQPADAGAGLVFAQYPIGPVILPSSVENTQAFWDQAASDAGISGIYGVNYPIEIDDGIFVGVSSTYSVSTDPIPVAQAIERICIRGGLSALQIDTDDVSSTVLGYAISDTYNGADSVRPLLTAFGLYGAEYDGQLHFHRLAEDAEIVIDPGELIAGDDQSDEATREQAKEYPRSILLSYIDPDQDYAVRPQPWRRITPDVRAIGEETMQVPVVMLGVDAARTVDTYGKRAWARAQGSRKFSVPWAGRNDVYLKLHAGKAFAMDGKRYVIDQLAIGDGQLDIEASYDRQSAYTSDVSPIPAPAPTPPPSSIGGVTLFAAMNLPRLRSKDNVPGMYVAAAGLLDGWPGCVLQLSTDNGATWKTAIPSLTQESVLGYLTAGIGTGQADTLQVNVHGGQLDSITDQQFIDGGNAAALVSEGVAEIIQFKDADELEPNEYNLTTLGRGRLGTLPASHLQGDRFVALSAVYFLPLDISLAGKPLLFRPVTFGTVPENNATYSAVFQPQFTGPQVIQTYVDADGNPYVDADGNYYSKAV